MTQVECSPVDLLPPELLSEVFSLLSSDQRHIANCRLVSHQWRDLSSSFLVTTVVIADRITVLQKFRETLDHPYFSKHVTTLTWDTSAYKNALAKTYAAYRRSCIGAAWKGQRRLVSGRVRQHHRATVKSLLEGVPESSVLASRPEASATATFLGDDDDGQLSDVGEGDLDLNTDIMYRGFAEYRGRFKDQSELRRRRLSLRYLHLAFKMLPSLRHFRFADFRCLARVDESFTELCARLFVCSLPPSLFVTKTGQYRSTLFQCMRNLIVISPRLESIALGHGNLDGSNASRQPGTFPIRMNKDYIPNDTKAWNAILSSIKRLELYVTLVPNGNQSGTKIPKSISKFLSHAQTSLRHLELTVKPYSEHHVLQTMFRASCAKLPAIAFELILGSRHFQKLSSVVLDGWYFLLAKLEIFLLAHRETLRELHLLDCCFRDIDEAAVIDSFCNKLPSALSLTGVELYGLVINGAPIKELAENEMQTFCELSQYQPLSVSPVGEDGQFEYCVATSCFENPHEIEAALMGGRANCLSNRLRKPKKDQQPFWIEDEDNTTPDQLELAGPTVPVPPLDTSSEETAGPDTGSQGTGRHRKRRARSRSFLRRCSLLCFK